MNKIGKLKTYTSKEIENSYVSIDFSGLDRELFNPDKCYDLLAKTGVKHARCQTGWARCERERGIYDFAWLDSIVDNLLNRGILPWFNVGYGNTIYMADAPNPTAVGCVPLYYGDETLTAWKNFICALTEHYKDRVTHYEIWNEADLKHFWYPEAVNGAEYAKLVNITGQIIREIQPEAKIGMNVSAPYNKEFIDALISKVKKENIDFFSYHTYSTVPEFRYARQVDWLRRSLDENDLSHVELWQGEGGYPSWAYEGHWLVKEGCDDERSQAVYQLRRYFLDVYSGAKLSSFFQMVDMWEKPYAKAKEVIEKPAAHGILNGISYTPKKSYETMMYLTAIFSGDIKPADDYICLDIDSPSPIDLLACQTMTFVKSGTPVYAYYLPAQLGKAMDIPYNASLRIYKPLENPVLIDLYTGEIFELSEGGYGAGTQTFTNLPLKDYPLILTEKNAFEIE